MSNSGISSSAGVRIGGLIGGGERDMGRGECVTDRALEDGRELGLFSGWEVKFDAAIAESWGEEGEDRFTRRLEAMVLVGVPFRLWLPFGRRANWLD